jgi:excisionase family DNA binding protein
MTKREAAAYMKVSVDTLNRWQRDGLITFYKVGELQTVRFKITDLDQLRKVADREVRLNREELDALHRPVERDPS